MKFWIKQRVNPQTGTYFVPCGQMPAKDARKQERALYGDNIMHGFASKKEYEARLVELRKAGETVYPK